ncbi:hypothetical protein, partial [Neolewinella agarilytica]|uniref:hypothetical protein n=1 Tax=Neolewinella agarilytica TaxID=478744 RepID=UPI002354C937
QILKVAEGADAGAMKENKSRVLGWLRPASDGERTYLFVVSFAAEPVGEVALTVGKGFKSADLLFATDGKEQELLGISKKKLSLSGLMGGRCYLLKSIRIVSDII